MENKFVLFFRGNDEMILFKRRRRSWARYQRDLYSGFHYSVGSSPQLSENFWSQRSQSLWASPLFHVNYSFFLTLSNFDICVCVRLCVKRFFTVIGTREERERVGLFPKWDTRCGCLSWFEQLCRFKFAPYITASFVQMLVYN